MYDTLYKHETAKGWAHLEEDILKVQGFDFPSCHHWSLWAPETDAASDNDKLISYRMS